MNNEINVDRHLLFLKENLMLLLPENSFSSRFYISIGDFVDAAITQSGSDSLIDAFNKNPVENLYFAIRAGLSVNSCSFEDEYGLYVDDFGEIYPDGVSHSIKDVELMASFGLWYLDVLECNGLYVKGDFENCYNPNDWNELTHLSNTSACLFMAYQALSCSQKLLLNTPVTSRDIRKSKSSHAGFLGSIKRHAADRELKEWSIALYKSRTWKNPNRASNELKQQIMNYGKTIDCHLSESNAQRTIYEWFRKCGVAPKP